VSRVCVPLKHSVIRTTIRTSTNDDDCSHGNNWCDVVDVGEQNSTLGNGGGQQLRSQRFTLLGGHSEHVQQRDDAVGSDCLKQPRRTCQSRDHTHTKSTYRQQTITMERKKRDYSSLMSYRVLSVVQ